MNIEQLQNLALFNVSRLFDMVEMQFYRHASFFMVFPVKMVVSFSRLFIQIFYLSFLSPRAECFEFNYFSLVNYLKKFDKFFS